MRLTLVKNRFLFVQLLTAVFFLPPLVCAAGGTVSAIDSEGIRVVLNAPAQRIISLSPHITELVFAAGAGQRLVGVVEFSDYPLGARKIKRIGSAFKVDMEALILLRPDLVVAWTSGNSASDIAKVKQLGIPVFYSDPKRLKEIPVQIKNISQLTETQETANKAARAFEIKYQYLVHHRSNKMVSVFYQLWHQPIMTVNKNHLIHDVIALCGGANVFSSLPSLTPVVGIEDVIAARPEVIVASSLPRRDVASMWEKWLRVTASSKNRIVMVPTDLLHRQGPRIIEAAEIICRGLSATRS